MEIENNQQGWVKLHRKIIENPLWTCETFTRGHAWMDLILLTNHTDIFFYKRGVKIDVKRGQCGWSELALSKRWRWSRNKVRKFLNDLEKEQQIIQQKNNVTQIITIINYEAYQYKKTTDETPKGHQKDTKRTLTRMNKNEKNEKNIKLHSENFKNFQQVTSYFEPKLINNDKWLDCYDKLIRIDKYTEDQILKIVQYFRSDGNWWKDSGNFNTLLKLRKTNKEGVKYIDVFADKIKSTQNTRKVNLLNPDDL